MSFFNGIETLKKYKCRIQYAIYSHERSTFSEKFGIDWNGVPCQYILTMIETMKPVVFLKQKKNFRLKLPFFHSTYSAL